MKLDKILKIIIIILVCLAVIQAGIAIYMKLAGNSNSVQASDYVDTRLEFSKLYDDGIIKFEEGFKVVDNDRLRSTGSKGNYVVNIEGINFGAMPVDKILLDAFASEGAEAVISMYAGKSNEPFAQVKIAEGSPQRYSYMTDELMIDASNAGFKGKTKIRLEIETKGSGRTFELRSIEFMTSTIPTLYFNIDESKGTIEEMNSDKENSCSGSLLVTAPTGYDFQYSEDVLEDIVCEVEEIHGRGNSTWDCDKKPYTVKLGSKEDLFGMGSAKKWVLLANYYDKSLMRNKLAYDLTCEMGMDYAVESVFVDVVMNNKYVGSYLLTEKIEAKKNRVDIFDLDDYPDAADEETINGGYLLQLYPKDRAWSIDKDYFMSRAWDKAVVIESPSLEESNNTAQHDYIMNYYYEFENALYSNDFCNSAGKRYSDYIDVDSFVDFYVVEEIFKNNDALYASAFLYKDKDEKMCIGPVWDMDLTAGTYRCNGTESPQGFFINGQYYFAELVRDPEFCRRVIERYNEIKGYVVQMYQPKDEAGLSKIRQYQELLDASQKMNFDKWGMGNRGWNAVLCQGSYEAEVDYLEDWLRQRIEWLDTNIERLMP